MKRALITGGTGFLGQHVAKAFRDAGWEAIPLGTRDGDLCQPDTFKQKLLAHKPDVVIHLAAVCGGIGINQRRPADFFYRNMLMGLHVVHECALAKVPRLVCAGSICGYPHTPPRIPFVEEDLHSGYPEPTNAPYGIVKRDLAVLLDAYRQQYSLDGCLLMPTNLMGIGDNFDLETSHVIPALIRKILAAKAAGASCIILWGTGAATRDFLDVRDAARAFLYAAERPGVAGPLNLGSGREISIRDLAALVTQFCGWQGRIEWDSTRPDGQPRRVLDSTKAWEQLGWQADISLEKGLADMVAWWQAQSR